VSKQNELRVYNLSQPQNSRAPILLSVPHCGSFIPDELKDEYQNDKIGFIDDTDWFVDTLYSFGPSMGITLLSANISRWVIDLNRHPESKPLYSDGRVITGLCPATDFLGNSLYNDSREEVSTHEVKRRLKEFYKPYHDEIEKTLNGFVNDFGQALIWDCHSIRDIVPTIRPDKFPDLILGDADGTTASPGVIELALGELEKSGLQLSHNTPFKGGYITRHYGRPADGVHALQLEMTKVNYMDDEQKTYHPERAGKMQETLKSVFGKLIEEFFH